MFQQERQVTTNTHLDFNACCQVQFQPKNHILWGITCYYHLDTNGFPWFFLSKVRRKGFKTPQMCLKPRWKLTKHSQIATIQKWPDHEVTMLIKIWKALRMLGICSKFQHRQHFINLVLFSFHTSCPQNQSYETANGMYQYKKPGGHIFRFHKGMFCTSRHGSWTICRQVWSRSIFRLLL